MTPFLRVAGAPLDNNIVERALKRAVLHRKNALFYRTLNGAQVGDLFMSLIHTCQLCGANSFDYLIELQRHARGTGGQPGGVDAVELPRDAGAGWSMMNPAWPKRIVSGHGRVTLRNGRQTGLSRRRNRQTFLASDANRRKCSGLACMPVFPPMTSRRSRCRAGRCGNMPPGAAGRSPCKSARLTPVRRKREAREKLLEAARRREIDVVLVWRLDRWGRSVTDLLATLQELEHLGVGFVSLTEALDLTTPAGRAMAGLLAIFAEFEREILRERTRAGLAHARQNGKRLGRPATAAAHAAEIRKLHRAGVSKSEIARRLQIGRTSVRRILGAKR